MNLRSAGPADAEAIHAFWLAHAEPTSTDRIDSVVTVLEHDAADVLVAEDSGEIVGTIVAAWDGWRGNIYRLAVATDRRRQSIGRTLIEAAEASLRSRGATRVAAIVIDDHDYAVATWLSAGYWRADNNGRYLKMLD